MECFGTTDFDNNSRLITLSAIIISGLHCTLLCKYFICICYDDLKCWMKIQVLLDVQLYQLKILIFDRSVVTIPSRSSSPEIIYVSLFWINLFILRWISWKFDLLSQFRLRMLFLTLSTVRIYKNPYVSEVGSTSISIHIDRKIFSQVPCQTCSMWSENSCTFLGLIGLEVGGITLFQNVSNYLQVSTL